MILVHMITEIVKGERLSAWPVSLTSHATPQGGCNKMEGMAHLGVLCGMLATRESSI